MLAAFLIMGNIFLHWLKRPESLKKNEGKGVENLWKGQPIGYFVMLNKEKAQQALLLGVWEPIRPWLTSISDGRAGRSSQRPFLCNG